MVTRISQETGEAWPHGTNQRYLYEVQLSKDGGADPCRECKDAHREANGRSKLIRAQILARFKREYPDEYRDWYAEFKERYDTRSELPTDVGSEASPP